MPNTLLSSTILAKETLLNFENNLTFSKYVTKKYDNRFARTGGKIGDTLDLRLPVRFTVSTGQAMDLQDVEEKKIQLVIDTRRHIAFSFPTQDLTLTIDEFSERYLQKAGATLANQFDYDGCQLYKDIANQVGTPGTVPTAQTTYLTAGQYLDEEGVPFDDMRSLCITPEMNVEAVNMGIGDFHEGKELSDQYKQGRMGTALGFKWSRDQNLPVHIKGTHSTGSTPLTNGAGTEGASSVVTDGWQASTAILKEGDVITIGSVNGVNPQSRQTWADCASSWSPMTFPAMEAATQPSRFPRPSTLLVRTRTWTPSRQMGQRSRSLAPKTQPIRWAWPITRKPLCVPASIWNSRRASTWQAETPATSWESACGWFVSTSSGQTRSLAGSICSMPGWLRVLRWPAEWRAKTFNHLFL